MYLIIYYNNMPTKGQIMKGMNSDEKAAFIAARNATRNNFTSAPTVIANVSTCVETIPQQNDCDEDNKSLSQLPLSDKEYDALSPKARNKYHKTIVCRNAVAICAAKKADKNKRDKLREFRNFAFPGNTSLTNSVEIKMGFDVLDISELSEIELFDKLLKEEIIRVSKGESS